MLDKIIALRYNKSRKVETSNRKLERLTKDSIALRYKNVQINWKVTNSKNVSKSHKSMGWTGLI